MSHWWAPDFAVEPFGGHVLQSPDQVVGLGQVFAALEFGESEVGHPGGAVSIEQQVRRLDVAVQHTSPVGVVERIGHCRADPGDLAVVAQLV